MAPNGDIDTSIFDQATKCDSLFEKRLSSLPGDAKERARIIEEQYQRFSRWAGYLGVLAEPQVSLDNRLKSVPDIRDWVLDLLEILETNLKHDLNTDRQAQESHGDQDGKQKLANAASASIFQAALEGIQESINRLHRLGNVIRKSSTAQLASRISKFARKRSDEEAFVARMNFIIVKGLYPSITDSFVNQLAKSISFRRQRFLYEKDRHQTLDTRRQQQPPQTQYNPPAPMIAVPEPTPRLTPMESTPGSQSRSQRMAPTPSPAPNPSATSSIDSPSTIDPVQVQFNLAEQKEKEVATGTRTASSVTYKNIYPRAPEWSNSKKHCQCDWCFKDVTYTRDEKDWERAWKTHFKDDLEPYICISEDCAEQPLYFVSLRKWREHMDDCHSLEWAQEIHKPYVWYCDSNQHAFQQFSTSADLRKHLMEDHKGGYDQEEKETMLTRNVLLKPRGLTECPLCGQDGTIENFQHHTELKSKPKLDEQPGATLKHKPEQKVRLQVPEDHINSDEEEIDVETREVSGLEDTPSRRNQNDEQVRHLKLTNHIALHLKSLAFTSLRYFDDETTSVNSGEAALGAANADLADEYKDDHYFELESELDFPDSSQENVDDDPVAQDESEQESESESQSGSESEPGSESLADLVLGEFVATDFDDRKDQFLPEGRLSVLVTEQSVRHELGMDNADNLDVGLISWILDEAKKVFAITIIIGVKLKRAMKAFHMLRFGDDMLPIEEPGLERSGNGAVSKMFNPHIWGKARKRAFYREQWSMLAPVFRRNQELTSLPAQSILPFTWVNKATSEGHFSRVFEVLLHPSHQVGMTREGNVDPVHLAIKEFRTRAETEEGEMLKEWEAETRALNDIGGLRHPHIVASLATFARGQRRYHMFSWASGGNLRDFWRNKLPSPTLSSETVLQAITQLRGLVDALYALHNFRQDDGASFRHGDLKPENILVFPDDSALGTLKMSDMGLAKFHSNATELRNFATGTRFGTLRYEPPEAVLRGESPRSRLYDIWSFGCITLELLVWLLYGQDGLDKFSISLRSASGEPSPFFEVEEDVDAIRTARIHRSIVALMSYIQDFDPELSQESAARDLLDLIKNRLLIIELRRPGISYTSHTEHIDAPVKIRSNIQTKLRPVSKQYRADAGEIRDALDNILDKVSNRDGYSVTGKSRIQLPPHFNRQRSLAAPTLEIDSQAPVQLSIPIANYETLALAAPKLVIKHGPFFQALTYSHKSFTDSWEFQTDNKFASKALETSGTPELSGNSEGSLCYRCSRLDFCAPGFYIQDEVADLTKRADFCVLCNLLLAALRRVTEKPRPYVRFERINSVIRIDDIPFPPALSLCKDLDFETSAPIQVGDPRLAKTVDESAFGLARVWLRYCDDNHVSCFPKLSYTPKRLLHIGAIKLRLYESDGSMKTPPYAALSHLWGTGPHFITTPANITDLRRGIDLDSFPAALRDAAYVCRALGIEYLWIDSLCIIQGPEGDWFEEATLFDDVFNGAYVVLSATCSTGMHDGFLRDRPSRHYRTLECSPRKGFYVCDFIDDFDRDVSESPLYKRAWTLQERIFARRTIFFTATQLYWQCGQGIRCETMTSMTRPSVSLLGDPNFPQASLKEFKTFGVQLVQSLYRTYSRLALSNPLDRPFAIVGIEQRLARALGHYAAFGVFVDPEVESVFARYLLWHRGHTEIDLIKISIDRPTFAPPSWSWTAYQGGIDYVEVPFGQMSWISKALRFPDAPFQSTSSGSIDTELIVIAQDFALGEEDKVIYDSPSVRQSSASKCVIVGKLIRRQSAATFYALLVQPVGSSQICERIGIAVFRGSLKRFSEVGVELRLR